MTFGAASLNLHSTGWKGSVVRSGGEICFLRENCSDCKDCFRKSNIRAIALKGPALAASVYGNIGFREFSDLDFLVRRDQVITAAHVLMNEKFISEFEPTAATQESFLNTQCEMVLMRDDSILVEIHWAFAPR